VKPRSKHIQRIGAGLIVIAIGLFAWAVWPLPLAKARLTISGDTLTAPASEGGGRLEGRTVELEYPQALRWGDIGQVSIVLAPDPTAGTRAAGINVEAEASLDLPGAVVAPADVTSTALLVGRANRFTWQVLSLDGQPLDGRAWLYFHLIPTNGSAEARIPISAQPLKIDVLSLAGMGVGAVRWLSGGAAMLGIAGVGWGSGWGRKRARRPKIKNDD
jgi:hypothetical protein